MNRKDICKNIIQSIKEYITNPDKLEAHRAKNHFVRKRKLSMYQIIMYLISFHRYLASERSAALEHLKCLEDLNIYHDSIVIFDRGYYSEKMFRYCVEHNHLCLMRLKENYNIAKNAPVTLSLSSPETRRRALKT